MPSDATEQPRAGSQREHIVVARRYRPQTFAELVGQDVVRQGLSAAITTSRVGHAYLFTGARGTGKTSTARIFAKALNCERGMSPTPCNLCDVCRGITAGSDIDVLEIDGASNRGIDDIRQIRANVAIKPSRARFKIYIIDEVHMVTKDAFNALLKTLEEPPEHVKFLFCTTDPEKIPITVLSRCQRFDFAPVATNSIEKRLMEIAAAEGVVAEPAAIQLIARRAAGSMRDSQSLLEQLLSVGGGSITVDDVHRMLGSARMGRLTELLEQMASRNPAAALACVAAAVKEGVDAGQLAEQLLGQIRDLLAIAVGASADLLLHNAPDDLPRLQAQAGSLGAETLMAMLQILDNALVRMQKSGQPRTVLEMALVRICRLEALDDLATWIGQLQSGNLAGPSVAPASAATRMPIARANPPPAAASSPAGAEKKTELTAPSSDSAPPNPPPAANLSPASAFDIWKQAIATIGDMVEDMGQKALAVATSGPNRLAVAYPATYIKEYCERPAVKARIEQALAKITGGIVRVDFEVRGGDEPRPIERPAARPNERELRRAVEKNPFVQAMTEQLGAEIDRVFEPRT